MNRRLPATTSPARSQGKRLPSGLKPDFRHKPNAQGTRLRTVAVGSALSLLLAACGSANSTTTSTPAASASLTSHTLHVPLLGQLSQPIDPDVYYAGQGMNIIDNVYNTLVQYKLNTATPTIVPDLATKWAVSPNGLVYTFTLRSGVTFHDGTPFNCSAIGPDFQRRLAVNQGPAYMVKGVASVTCPSPLTAVITLSHPENDFLDMLASEYGPRMISPTALAKHAGTDHAQAWLSTHDAGTGPYTVASANPSTGYVLKAYPGYWGPKPYYTTIDLPIVPSITTQQLELQTGQVTIIEHSLPTRSATTLRSNPNLTAYTLPTEQGEMISLNPLAPGLGSAAVRKAIEEGINKQAIVSTVYPGGAAHVATQIYPPGQLPTPLGLEHTGYHPVLLSNLKSKLGTTSITVGYQSGFPNQQQIANLIQAQLSAKGLTVQVVAVPGAQMYGFPGTSPTSPSILVYNPWPDAASPYTWAHIAYDLGGGLSFFSCPAPTASATLAKAVQVISTVSAQKLYSTAGGQYASTRCWDWLANKSDVMVAQKGLAGVRSSHSVMAPYTLIFANLHPAGK